MKISCDQFTTKVHRYKEDNVVVKNNFLYSVINGLPFLYSKEKNLNMTTRFINDVKNALNHFDGKQRLAHYLYNISKDEFNKFSILKNYDNSYYPACGLAIVYFEDDFAELYTLGDCYIAYETKDNKKFMMYSQEVVDVNTTLLNSAVEYSSSKKCSLRKSINMLHEEIVKNRKLLNSNNGSNTYTISKVPQFKFSHQKVKIDNLKEVLLFSDGFAQSFQLLSLFENYEELLKDDLNISELSNQILKIWESDRRLKKYPRLSYKEDITVLKLLFE
ncbi:MAG: hypothetical protein ACI311_00375 [Bacilli bacterium]